MRILLKLSAFAAFAGMSRVVLAQQVYSYNVSWGVQSLPFSPWLSMIIGLMLLFATYAFIRRSAGQGLFMLATATLVGTLALYTDDMAYAPISLYAITTPNGSNTFSCGSSYAGYQNNTGSPVNLTVTPLNGGPTSTNSGFCFTGAQLSPNGGYCIMPCVPG